MTSPQIRIHRLICPHCSTVNFVAANAIRVSTPIDCSKCQASLGTWGEARLKYGHTGQLRAHG